MRGGAEPIADRVVGRCGVVESGQFRNERPKLTPDHALLQPPEEQVGVVGNGFDCEDSW